MKRKAIIWGSLKIHQSLCSSPLGMFLRRDVYTSSTEFHTNQSSWSNSRQIFPDKALPIENFQTELHHLLRAFQEQLDWLFVKFLSLLQQQTGKVFCSQLTRVWRHLLGGTGGESVNSIQLSPKGEVNSGGDLLRREASRYITSTVHWPWGDSCFSIYQISWIKLKKVTFCKLKTPLSRNLFTVYKHFEVCQVHFTILLQIQQEGNFLTYQQNTDKPKVVAFLIFVCTTTLFIAQILSSKNVSKRDAILAPGTKQWIAKDILSYGNQSNCTKIANLWFGK